MRLMKMFCLNRASLSTLLISVICTYLVILTSVPLLVRHYEKQASDSASVITCTEKESLSKLKSTVEKLAQAEAKLTLLNVKIASAKALLIRLNNSPKVRLPSPIPLPFPPILTPINQSSEPHCRMHSCFDYSLCSFLEGFSIYLYPKFVTTSAKDEGIDSALDFTIRKSLMSDNHITLKEGKACVGLLLVGEDGPFTFADTCLNWLGDGRNNIILNIARRELSEVATSRAMVVQSTFRLHNFRPGFDLVMPVLDEAMGDPWRHSPPMAPARRRYLLSFQSKMPLFAQSNQFYPWFKKFLYETAEMLPVADEFYFDFECGVEMDRNLRENKEYQGDWALCGTNVSRYEVLKHSTFSLIIAPFLDEIAYGSTALLLIRLSEALATGAIPVILGGDRVRLPYDEVIDWRKATLQLPTGRASELYFLLHLITDADILAFRKQGRALWERYLSSVEAIVDTLLAVIRSRLNIPALPVTSVTRSTFYPLKTDPVNETLEFIGPIEAPFASKRYQRNFTVGLLNGYEMWNEWYEPFALFPQLPWDPVVTPEARFMDSLPSYSRTIVGKGGDRRFEFAQALGGDYPHEQFTIVILTHNGKNVLTGTLSRLQDVPFLNKVIVVWNDASDPWNLIWPKISAPIAVLRSLRNSLNHRFLPYDIVETEAVLCLDDDSLLDREEILLGFWVWRENRDRIVGFPGRHYEWNTLSFDYKMSMSCELSMVLTGAAFIHRYYLWAYWRTLPAEIRNYVDEQMNCEDIAMNFLVAHITRKPPIKVAARLEFNLNPTKDRLSKKKNHKKARHKCMEVFSKIMGYTPLKSTQFRADSVLYNADVQDGKGKCFNRV